MILFGAYVRELPLNNIRYRIQALESDLEAQVGLEGGGCVMYDNVGDVYERHSIIILWVGGTLIEWIRVKYSNEMK